MNFKRPGTEFSIYVRSVRHVMVLALCVMSLYVVDWQFDSKDLTVHALSTTTVYRTDYSENID